ncbi:helix-turn-helix transcriptional regulator [Marinobacter sp.]|uniref:helix-turn-helix transcriptional regulator n=1 Tax=Marinobacter sp. TaxID=50741 RepID=UPI003850B1EB
MGSTKNRKGAAAQDYTAEIGERVRAIRARRGMPRKELSNQSGISERYLAEVESGKANISIVLLQGLAAAMGVPLQELLPGRMENALPAALLDLLHRLSASELDAAFKLLNQHFGPHKTQQAGVALIGLRGGGKTSLGRMLASEFGKLHIRLSNNVEQLGGMSVGEIMALGGQPGYRRIEREALEHVLEQPRPVILEAGGSLVSEPETFQRLLSSFYTVWIKAAPQEHMQRVIEQGDTRPMKGTSRAMDDLKRILAEREAEYRQADYILDTSNRSIDDCFSELADVCRPHLTNVPEGATKKAQAGA